MHLAMRFEADMIMILLAEGNWQKDVSKDRTIWSVIASRVVQSLASLYICDET